MKRALIEFLLQRRGLFYYGPDADLEAEVEKHHPGIFNEASAIATFVEKRLAHDAVFKEGDK